MSLDPKVEAAALSQTEDAMRELVQTARNCGMHKESLAMMLRAIADELSPPLEVEHHTIN